MEARRFSLMRLLHCAEVLLAAVVISLACAAPGHGADKLRVSNCYIGGGILPLWMAKDAGDYEREGLDVEQIWIQGNPATAFLRKQRKATREFA